MRTALVRVEILHRYSIRTLKKSSDTQKEIPLHLANTDFCNSYK